MGMKRRDFIGTALAAGVAAAASPLRAQQAPAGAAGGAGGGRGAQPPKTTTAIVEKLWNMRFAKRVRLAAGQSVEARFDFFNIFNANLVTSQSRRVGPSYLIPSGIILPRILQMGVTYEF